jgi:large subunit ribosomal protein L19
MIPKEIEIVEQRHQKPEIPDLQVGDLVDVHVRILEGDKERIQVFSGVVISISGGGLRKMFTVRRIVQGEGVERTFPFHSPRVAKVEVRRRAKVRRAKLYYLRERLGKAARLRERRHRREELLAEQQTAEEEAQPGNQD